MHRFYFFTQRTDSAEDFLVLFVNVPFVSTLRDCKYHAPTLTTPGATGGSK